MPARMPSSRAALTFVLLSVFIDSLGFGIIIPSLPSVIMELTGEPVSTAADWSGYLMAVYALLQFFMAPIFGNLSDRFGRRPLLLFSLFAFGVDFLLTGLAKSMTWLFVGRAFAGVFGASFSTAGAYIGDISNDENRARNFGFIGAAWGSGFTLGPVIGGFVAEAVDPRAPFFVAAALALANVAFGFFALPESLPVERRRKFEWVRANPFGALKSLAHLPMVAGLLFAVFLYQIAHDSLPAVWMFYTQHKFGWGPAETGWSLTFVGVMTVIVMGGLTGYAVPRLGERRAIVLGFRAHDAGLPGLCTRAAGLDDLPGARDRFTRRHRQSRDAERDVETGRAERAGRAAGRGREHCERRRHHLAAIHDAALQPLLDAGCVRATAGSAVSRGGGAGVLLRVDCNAYGTEAGNGVRPRFLENGA
jgi:DHA1 family tetracycline resistance protein-like MFS transporter